jgi:AraC-like DNA-binding protein
LREGYIFSCPAGLIHYTVPVFADGKHAYSILAGPVALEYPDIAVVDNLIQQCGCSLDYRKRLYGALGAVPIVEPVRLQYLNQLLFSLTDYMEKAFRVAESGPTDLGSVSDRRKHERARAGGMGTVMEKALDYIEEHFHGNLHLEEVARYVGLNASYFSQFFKREQGETFSQYLIRKKLEAACLLLKETHLTLAEISSELGFENQSYFSRLFKKRMGLSPNQYRRREGLLEAAEKEDMGME